MKRPVALIQDHSESNQIFVHSNLDDAGLSSAAFRVYCHLSRRAGKGDAYPGIDSMARVCCLAKNTVITAARELEARGMIIAYRETGRTTVYELTKPSTWIPSQNEERSETVANEVTVDRRKPGNAPSQTGERTVAKEVTKGNPERESKEVSAPMRELTDSWCAGFEKAFSVKYKFQGGRDGKAAAALIAFTTVADVMAIAEKAWLNPEGFWSKHAATLHSFEKHFNEIRHEVSPAPVIRGQRPPQRTNANARFSINQRLEGVSRSGINDYGAIARRKIEKQDAARVDSETPSVADTASSATPPT